jgi:hypothetical protein
MVKLIQHKETRQFLGVTGGWTTDVNDAAEFHSVRDAMNYCLEQSIRHNVQLVLRSPQSVFRLEVFPARD